MAFTHIAGAMKHSMAEDYREAQSASHLASMYFESAATLIQTEGMKRRDVGCIAARLLDDMCANMQIIPSFTQDDIDNVTHSLREMLDDYAVFTDVGLDAADRSRHDTRR